MNMVGEIVAKATSSGHILRSIIPIYMKERSLYVMVTQRKRHRFPKEVVATYVVGHMAMRGNLNLRTFVLSCERGNIKMHKMKDKV